MLNIEVCYNKTMFICECGESFIGQKYNANKYCSMACQNKYRWPNRKFKKINGVWFKGQCDNCKTPIKGQYAKLCHECYWVVKRNPVIIAGKPIPHYHAVHYWIKEKYGKPTECENCGYTHHNSRKFNWANLSGEYLRDRSDWKRLCVTCHILMDNKERRSRHESSNFQL